MAARHRIHRLRGAKRALERETGLSAILRLTLLKTKVPNRVLTVPVALPN